MKNSRNASGEKNVETYALPYERESAAKKNKKRKSTKKRLLIGTSVFLAVLFLLIGTGVYVIFHYINKINYDDGTSQGYEEPMGDDDVDSTLPNSPDHEVSEADQHIKDNSDDDSDLLHSDQVINILLIGTDGRKSTERGRSDSMILVSINKVSKKIYMSSFMRDMYVNIPGVESNNRINASYSKGGADLLLKTIKSNFKIKVDQYVRVNFESFKDTIDLLGGVEMTVTNTEATQIPGISSGGTYILNGEQALEYSRIRKVGGGGDFARTQRQRKVLNVLWERCKKLSVSELTSLLDQLLPNLTTNIPSGEIFSHILASPTYFGYETVQQQIPCDGSWSNMTVRHMAVLRVDFDKNIEHLKNTVYEGIY